MQAMVLVHPQCLLAKERNKVRGAAHKFTLGRCLGDAHGILLDESRRWCREVPAVPLTHSLCDEAACGTSPRLPPISGCNLPRKGMRIASAFAISPAEATS